MHDRAGVGKNKGFKGREMAKKKAINYDISDLALCDTAQSHSPGNS